MQRYLLLVLLLFPLIKAQAWGFKMHRLIARQAVLTLPPAMMAFFKPQLPYISEQALAPDKRRHSSPGEAPRHYLDMEAFEDSLIFHENLTYDSARSHYGKKHLAEYGKLPWHVLLMKYRLTEAFRARHSEEVLRLAAELCHYVADAQVPLHTTLNYDGQLTGQEGIHALWESRLPELYGQKLDYWPGKPRYLYHPQDTTWASVRRAHGLVAKVLQEEKRLSQTMGPEKKYTHRQRKGQAIKTYSRPFCRAYFRAMEPLLERQLSRSIGLTASFWYTAWVDAGQPDLAQFPQFTDTPKPDGQ